MIASFIKRPLLVCEVVSLCVLLAGAQTASDHINKGNALADAGNLEQAIIEFTNAIRLDPRNAVAYANRAGVFFDKENFEKALSDANRAIELDPDLATAYTNRCVAYAQTGRLNEAVADCNKAINLDPNIARAYGNRGFVYLAKKDYDQAIADCNQAIALDSGNYRAFTVRGYAKYNKLQYDGSRVDFHRALEIKPGFVMAEEGFKLAESAWQRISAPPDLRQFKRPSEVHFDDGMAYLKDGKYQEAIDNFRPVIDLHLFGHTEELAGPAYRARAQAYSGLGRYELAISDYQSELKLNPGDLSPHVSIAFVYLYMNKGDMAYKQAEDFLELNGLKGEVAPHAIIAGYLGLRKSGKSAAANVFLNDWRKQITRQTWTTSIIKFMGGELTAAQLLALADTNSKLVEAHSYIGEMQLMSGLSAKATVHFDWVLKNGDKRFWEYQLAVAELTRPQPTTAKRAAPARKAAAGKKN